jgi:hypothetical protein
MSDSDSDNEDTGLNNPRAEQLLAEYEEAVDGITYSPEDLGPDDYDSHFNPFIKTCLELGRTMKDVKEEHHKADKIAETLMAEFEDSEYVDSKITAMNGYKGRDQGEFDGDAYCEAISLNMNEAGLSDEFGRYREDIYEVVAAGKVGKLLWWLLKSSIQLKSKIDFWTKIAKERRHEPTGFAQVALDAAEGGDERLAKAAKRALECEALEREVRRKFGAEALAAVSAEAKERVAEVLG